MNKQRVINYRVLNRRQQPVEMLCEDRVVILPPKGEVIMSANDQSLPQVQSLLKRRLISVIPHEIGLPEPKEKLTTESKKSMKPEANESAKSEAKESGKKRRTSKSKTSPKEK